MLDSEPEPIKNEICPTKDILGSPSNEDPTGGDFAPAINPADAGTLFNALPVTITQTFTDIGKAMPMAAMSMFK